MQAITSASESDTLVPSSQEAQSDTGSKTTSNKSTDTTDSDTESTTNKPSAETVTPEASAPSATPTPTPAATTTTTTQSVQAANTPATPTPTPTPTPQPEAVRSKVYIKAYYHPGNSDEVVPNAPVRFKNKNTGEVFTGFTNSSGKSPEFKFPMNTDVEVTLYSPRDWNTEYCGSTWTVNTGSYGSTKAENMRLFASASPCITE